MKYVFLLFAMVLFAAFPGCVTGRVKRAESNWAEARDEKAYGALVEHSASFRRAQAANPNGVLWYVEQAGKVPQIYLGHDMRTHNVRFATLRIRGGVVERLDLRPDGDEVWVADR